MALPYFWDHFDKDGWSLWYSEYRFPEELTQTFMSCNLITGEKMALGGGREATVVGDVISKAECSSSPLGMFQRLDKLRKNAFASVFLYRTNHSSSISRIWVFQGWRLPFCGAQIGLWTTSHMYGGDWMLAVRRPRQWLENTFPGKGLSSMWAKPSIKARPSSEHLLLLPSCCTCPSRRTGVIKGN